MDGPSLGRAIHGAVVGMLIMAFLAGGAVFALLWWLIPFICRHVKIY